MPPPAPERRRIITETVGAFGQVEVTGHAADRMQERSVSDADLLSTLRSPH
jgi:hypothetical protein